jgi:SAM-dependent methyltransferase
MSQRTAQISSFADVADDVRDFYDRYPYPPPLDNLESYQKQWQDPQRRRADFHLFWPGRSYREDQLILIAGCGTSQAAKHALRWPAAQVIGIDCSATSVECTQRLKRKYDLTNLEVRLLPIGQVSDLRMSFDQIVCTGVLHHLADPDAGLRALRSALKSDGAMQLMVYAPYGRAGIYMLQDFCRRIGIEATDEDIRHLIGALSSLPPGHPLQSLLAQAPDFRNQAALADALLHPQDRAYSVPQLLEFLDNAQLRFGRWVRQAPYSVHCGVMAKLPQTKRIASLPLFEQYAAVELFRGTMVRHSVIAYGSDGGTLDGHAFDDSDWLNYVPIRMPDTICVQDRLPQGASGVLINRSHTYKDLFLPIGSTEKGWFDLIDGIRSIREIVERTPPLPHRTTNLDLAHAFFERLWWHDQVVFDSSRPPVH